MADGSRKAISKVKVGDRVQARDPQTGERKAKPVHGAVRPPRHAGAVSWSASRC